MGVDGRSITRRRWFSAFNFVVDIDMILVEKPSSLPTAAPGVK